MMQHNSAILACLTAITALTHSPVILAIQHISSMNIQEMMIQLPLNAKSVLMGANSVIQMRAMNA